MSIWFVLASGAAHATWNLLAKRSGHKQVFLLLVLLPSTLLLLPVLVAELISRGIAGQSGLLLTLSMAAQAGYGYFFVQIAGARRRLPGLSDDAGNERIIASTHRNLFFCMRR
ncbi:hypothetical protein [Cohnella rhizosphaerae]|uniref:Uncharacterized protein n=1 Tax=Cohnella rhizosphaerae TaxID=1457232 RepID=A0A9X4KX06_9BACL|nr:hypothetical protein [Cohnella rhizosphaerae]MDG0812841.1 hypothetical protein [Cohnella rhizosphaerae]